MRVIVVTLIIAVQVIVVIRVIIIIVPPSPHPSVTVLAPTLSQLHLLILPLISIFPLLHPSPPSQSHTPAPPTPPSALSPHWRQRCCGAL